jgi:ribosomal protein S18 acetylase RimI-like enzyme
MSVNIVKATSSKQFQTAARLHAEGIQEGFLSGLGVGFLAKLYQGIAEAQDCGVLAALEEDEVLGFISYARDVKRCYRDVLKKHWPGLAKALGPNFLRLGFYRKVAETLAYPLLHRGSGSADSQPNSLPVRTELLSMAVGPQARGKGVGKCLVQEVDAAFQAMGLPGYFVVTHGVDERSNGFYLSCGFSQTRTFTSHGKPMNEYYKEFPTGGSSTST